MRINYNVSAMIANNALNRNDNALSSSLEKLSSGLKINHAKDNASGLAMAKRMKAQLRSIDTATQNSNDGISVIEIAEGALQEVHDMIQRMSELAVKAANGTMEDPEREMIDAEINQLKTEINRISETTMYNGEVLLNGNFDVKGYTDNANLKVATYSDDVRSGNYGIESITAVLDADGNIDKSSFDIKLKEGFPENYTYEIREDNVTILAANGFEMQFQVVGDLTNAQVNLDITGLGTMNLQTGTNEDQELAVRIAAVNTKTLGLTKVNCSTQEKALEFMDRISESLAYVSFSRSRLGAYQNRLEHTVSTLDISNENMTAAYSRIMDTDMAEEMTELSKNQVLVQASTSMLAQANERPSSVLQLLQ